MPEIKKQASLSPGQQKELEKRLLSMSKDNRLNCSSAFAIARSLGIPPGEVGKAANKLDIKISNCQLGCF